ncbi:MAG: catalase/peroxidase HPI [Crocinitomix sp.]|nr:catalase/peroxidase HPI [Crocinitomix sp.]
MSENTGKCPFNHGIASSSAGSGTSNREWWPNQLKLNILRQHTTKSNPMDEGFDYKKAFSSLDLKSIKKDLNELMTDSQDWWPADYGHYGPLFIRMAWHSAGTYRIQDGRGGAVSGSQRFAPLNSWPDNGNLDKARLLLWPIKQKYGAKISWADLLILAGNCALESMGFETYGFGGGREDIWEPEADVNWGTETDWLGDKRNTGERDLENPLGAVQMGLIYVNPEGPNGNPDPLKSAVDIRETFARMAMNDEETVALVAGGHTFGKAHGAADPDKYVGREPEAAPIEAQGKGWISTYGTGHGDDTITSGVEGAWTPNPAKWDHDFFRVLLDYDWELSKSPAGAHQWKPTAASNPDKTPAAHNSDKLNDLMMTTADMALKMDPAYLAISTNFKNNPAAFEKAFAKAWFKLTHRDMGPAALYLGEEVPQEELIWQDPIPTLDHELINESDIADLKSKLLVSGLSISQLVSTAWAAASTFRGSDKRGGANGGRIRLAPQKNWKVNNPAELEKIVILIESIQADFNSVQSADKKVSFADLVVLGGAAAIEEAAKNAGQTINVPFIPGRTDASQAQTDIESFEALQPIADGFRNYSYSNLSISAEEMLVDKAQLLNLTAPEMTVLVGGLRVLNSNFDKSNHGVFTKKTGELSNDFFINLLDMSNTWKATTDDDKIFDGSNRRTGELNWKGTRADLIFGSNSELRAISEVYASEGSNEKFISDFVSAWTKVMQLDRFDLD